MFCCHHREYPKLCKDIWCESSENDVIGQFLDVFQKNILYSKYMDLTIDSIETIGLDSYTQCDKILN